MYKDIVEQKLFLVNIISNNFNKKCLLDGLHLWGWNKIYEIRKNTTGFGIKTFHVKKKNYEKVEKNKKVIKALPKTGFSQ
jgi:hypothetical protein